MFQSPEKEDIISIIDKQYQKEKKGKHKEEHRQIDEKVCTDEVNI